MQKTNIPQEEILEGQFKDLALNIGDYKMPEYTEEDWKNDLRNDDFLGYPKSTKEVLNEIEPLFGKPKKKQCKKQ